MNATLTHRPQRDYKVADLALADFGRKEIATRRPRCPVSCDTRGIAAHSTSEGARISGSLHMTIQTAVLIGPCRRRAQVRWASCNIFSTQDHAAAPSPPRHGGVRLEGRIAPGTTGSTRTASSSGPTRLLQLDPPTDAVTPRCRLHLGVRRRERPG